MSAYATVTGEGRSVSFSLPFLPPSINSIYQINHRLRKVYLSDAARKWKSDCQFLIPRFEITEGAFLHIAWIAHYKFHHRNGRLRRFDTSNMEKILLDAICERWGVDDCIVKSGSFESVDSENNCVSVLVCEVLP